MSRRDQLFESVTTEGALLPSDFLNRLAQRDREIQGLTPDAYHLGSGEKLNEAISRSWNRVLGVWKSFSPAMQALPASDAGTTLTREKWLLPLFQELGYGRLQTAKPFEFEGRRYSISHGWQHAPMHLVSFRAELDARSENIVGARTTSPHSMVQEFLNRSTPHVWAIVSNGLRLRLLRDNVSLTRQAFVEFDLQSMMQGELYADFALLWLLLHQSRVEGERAELCWLERWTQEARQRGARALDQLRDGVEEAITALGSGFLAHPANIALRDKLTAGTLSKQDYFRQLLRVVYRFLFLFAAEDRELLHRPAEDYASEQEKKAAAKAKETYRLHYSVNRLRRIANRLGGTQHADLWHNVRLLFTWLGSNTGCPALGLPALGSFLWSARATPDLDDCLMANRDLLAAIRALAFTEQNKVRRPIDYKNIGTEELGSVYESLLEQHPDVHIPTAKFVLGTHAGNERKTTGSHYTPPPLVNCLLDSALEPVLQERERDFTKLGFKSAEEAILSLKVCDKAVGSGHFLIGAAHRIAKRLAAVRTGDGEPAPAAVRHALRDVIGRCLYGVDINPMAVELCKFALWLEALEPGKPLSFLDHHIRCGNSLLGATPELIKGGIPDAAYDPIEGDSKEACSALKNRNKRENPKLGEWFIADEAVIRDKLFKAAAAINEIGDDQLEEIERKEAAFRDAQTNYDFQKAWDLADLWCAAFVIKKQFTGGASVPTSRESTTLDAQPLATQGGLFGGTEELPKAKDRKAKAASRADSEDAIGITTQHLRDFVAGGSLPDGLLAEAKRLAGQYQFFHWHLAFPEVFKVPPAGQKQENELCGWNGGFDVILGNPPWDKINFRLEEHFAISRPDIALAKNQSIRKELLKSLNSESPSLYAAYLDAKRTQDGISNFFRFSGAFPLTGVSRINLYSVFAELACRNTAPGGKMGMVIASGIVTDDNNKELFEQLMVTRRLESVIDFENRDGIFPAVDSRYKFCLITVAGSTGSTTLGKFLFYLTGVEQIKEKERQFSITPQELALINPQTKTCPVFRTARDAELTKGIYGRIKPWCAYEQSPTWPGVPKTPFNLSNDAHLLLQQTAAENTSHGNAIPAGAPESLRLYEAKMMHQFNHRFATFEGTSEDAIRNCAHEMLASPFRFALPRYWIRKRDVQARFSGHWFFCYREISNSTNERTAIATVLPEVGCSYTLVVIEKLTAVAAAILCCNMNSFAYDYVARQKTAGVHLNQWIWKQLPQPAVDDVDDKLKPLGISFAGWLLPRVLELTYTAWDLEAFAQDCGWSGPPFRWDDERRFLLRCELDAAFFHLYGLNRDDSAYILDTFPIVKRKDEAKFGDYRTKLVILKIYDAMKSAMDSGQPYQTLLNPPPADPRCCHPPKAVVAKLELPTGARQPAPNPQVYLLQLTILLLHRNQGTLPLDRMLDACALVSLPDMLVEHAAIEFGDVAKRWRSRFRDKIQPELFLPMLRDLIDRNVIRLKREGNGTLVVLTDVSAVPKNAEVEFDAGLALGVVNAMAMPELEALPEIVPDEELEEFCKVG